MVLHQCNSILILPTVLKNRKEQENVGCPLKNHSFRVRSREQATTVHQRIHITTLNNCVKDFEGKKFTSPSLVIVGKVVGLQEQFSWFESGEEGTVFHELAAKTK